MIAVKEIENLQEIMNNNPTSFVFARLADYYLQNEDTYRAIQICEDGIKQHPHYVNGHFVYGKSLLALELNDKAKDEFEKVLFYDPEHLGAHYYLAKMINNRGQSQNYLTELETILSIDPLFEWVSGQLKDVQAHLADETVRRESTLTEAIETAESPAEETEPESPIFMSEDQDIEKLVAEHLEEAPEPEEAAAPSPEEEEMTGEAVETPSEETSEAPVLEEQPADEKEKFDYILDEIFEDEVLTDESESPEDISEEDLTAAIQQKVSSFDESAEEPELFFAEEKKEPPEQEEAELEIEEPEREEVPVSETGGVKSTETEAVQDTAPETYAGEETAEKEEEQTPVTEKGAEVYPIHEQRKEVTAIVTPTLGEIYAAQEHYSKAIGVYEILLKKDPDNRAYREKVEYLKKKMREQQEKDGE